MKMPILDGSIVAEHLTKTYRVSKKKAGLRGALANLLAPSHRIVTAVNDVNFHIETGEIVGYLGPNGSGKSTTIKMLTGILSPSSGNVYIGGVSPEKRRSQVVQKIGVVFGQRTQLYWDLRLGESFELLRRIYRINSVDYELQLEWLDENLNLSSLIDIPVRQLSLGQRMRGEIAAALLHSPTVLFLDEPTIGLDLDAKHAIRKMIKCVNQTKQTTVILTTHDLEDVQELCSRLIVINHGQLVANDSLPTLQSRLSPFRKLTIEFTSEQTKFSHPKVLSTIGEGTTWSFEFDGNQISAAELISELIKNHSVRDIQVKEPSIEDLVKQLYATTVQPDNVIIR
jgi:ABC-2 type transport system ATP-binding protein